MVRGTDRDYPDMPFKTPSSSIWRRFLEKLGYRREAFDSENSGLVPSTDESPSTDVLRADGTWGAESGAAAGPVGSSGLTVNTGKILGRTTGSPSPGPIEEIGTAAGVSMITAANVAAQRTLLEYALTSSGKGASLVGVEAGTTNVEAALAAKQPGDTTLSGIASAGIAANKFLVGTSGTAFAKTTVTDYAMTILDDATAGDVRTTISAQALDATLTALAGLATGADKFPYSTGTDTFSQATLTAFARTLLDDTTAEGARQTLEVGNTEQHSVWWQDYLVPSASALGWSSSSSNGGFAQSWATTSDASNATGVVELNTASHRAGRYALLSWNDALVFNNETAYTFEARVNVSALSTSGDEYKATFGFSNKFNEEAGGSNETDYAYWIYRRSVDGDFWVAATAKDGTEEKTVTTTAPVGNDTTFVVLKIVVPADGSSVTYYIDGVEKAEHETNVPAVTDRLGIGFRIDKTAGTNERELRIDWHRFVTTRTAAR